MYTGLCFFLSSITKTLEALEPTSRPVRYGQALARFGIVTYFSFKARSAFFKARSARKPGAVLVRRTQGYPG
jgi:hypothetical protein